MVMKANILKLLRKLEKLEDSFTLEEVGRRTFNVQYEYPATATDEEKKAAKAAAWDRFTKEHPELEGRRGPILFLGLARGDIDLPGKEEP